jgi:hypothetical protein
MAVFRACPISPNALRNLENIALRWYLKVLSRKSFGESRLANQRFVGHGQRTFQVQFQSA